MRRRAATIIAACTMAAVHVLLVVIPVFSSHANGEGQAGAVLLFDLPLVLLVSVIPQSRGHSILYDDMTAYQWVFCLGGTLMYALVGAFIGWIIDVVRHRSRPA